MNGRPKPVLTKKRFVRDYMRGIFGNRAPTWDSLAEYQAANYRGRVHIRNREAGGLTFYNLKPQDVARYWRKSVSEFPMGAYISAMAPHDKGTIQGEIQNTPERGLYLQWCSAKLPMRESMAGGTEHCYGMRAVGTLQKYADPASYDWLQELLELYPDHVIEFSCFSVPWGTIPNRNTVFWEIRKY